MKASDLLKKTTITPDDDPRSKLEDEDEDEVEDFDKEEEDLDEDPQEVSTSPTDAVKMEEELEEDVTPRPTFKRDQEQEPKYRNIAGFSAASKREELLEKEPAKEEKEFEPDFEPRAKKGDTLDDLAALPEEDRLSTNSLQTTAENEEDLNRNAGSVSEEDMEILDIPNLKSHSNMPSSGIYSSHDNGSREFNTFNPPPRRGKSKNLLLQLVVLALIGFAVVGGTVYALKKQFNFGGSNASSPSPSVEVSVSLTPSPSPEVTIDRSKYTVRVLNGTSISGLAASVSAKLKDLGFKVERTGNATNSAFTQTQIRAKDSAVVAINQLIKDLAPNFQGASSSSALKSSDASDLEVILGTK